MSPVRNYAGGVRKAVLGLALLAAVGVIAAVCICDGPVVVNVVEGGEHDVVIELK